MPLNFVCDEPATAKHGFHRINVLMSRGSLPVATVPPKQVDEPGLSAGADKQRMIRNDGVTAISEDRAQTGR
jgi:hypothetical protein